MTPAVGGVKHNSQVAAPRSHYGNAQGLGGVTWLLPPTPGTAAVPRGAVGLSGCRYLRLPLLIHPVDLPADKHPDSALAPPLLAPQEVGDEQRETCPQSPQWEMQWRCPVPGCPGTIQQGPATEVLALP